MEDGIRFVKPNIDNTYYADLFIINNIGWMITGSGKSDAAYIASNKAIDADIARDWVILMNKKNELIGKDNNAGAYGFIPKIELPEQQIGVIAHCLTKDETNEYFNWCEKHLKKVTNDIIAHRIIAYKEIISSISRCPFDFNAEYRNFLRLTKNAIDVDFILVPYMPAVEEKAKLYIDYKK